MAISFQELHSFIGEFIQLCSNGFKANLTLSNNDGGIAVNLSADIGSFHQQTQASCPDMIYKKNTKPSQVCHRPRRQLNQLNAHGKEGRLKLFGKTVPPSKT